MDREQIADLAGLIYDSSNIAFKLVNNLLEWSMLETGKMKTKPENIDLNIFINNCILVIKDLAKNKNISLNLSGIGKNLIVWCDRNMLSSSLQNLLINAIKFTPQEGEIIVKTFELDNMIQIDIIDNGVGMTQQQLDKLFHVKTI